MNIFKKKRFYFVVSFFILVFSTLISYTTYTLHLNYNIEASLNFTQLVSLYNYPYETHKIYTDDGYELIFFRIQAKNTTIREGLPVVFLMHGFVCSSDVFILNNET